MRVSNPQQLSSLVTVPLVGIELSLEALPERLGLGVAALVFVKHGEVVDEGRCGGMIWAELLLAEVESLSPDRDGPLVLACPIEGPALPMGLHERLGLGIKAAGPQPQDGQDECERPTDEHAQLPSCLVRAVVDTVAHRAARFAYVRNGSSAEVPMTVCQVLPPSAKQT